MTTRVEVPEHHEQYVVQKIEENKISFQNGVIHVETGFILAKRDSILLEFNVPDMWDAENVKFSITSRLFARRLIHWLKDVGLSLSEEEQQQVRVTLSHIVEVSHAKKGKSFPKDISYN